MSNELEGILAVRAFLDQIAGQGGGARTAAVQGRRKKGLLFGLVGEVSKDYCQIHDREGGRRGLII